MNMAKFTSIAPIHYKDVMEIMRYGDIAYVYMRTKEFPYALKFAKSRKCDIREYDRIESRDLIICRVEK
nr:MAG TPA: hypothetical protein [Caudoviricetes sp.]